MSTKILRRYGKLTKFIEAMLAKQVWCLIHDTNSLFYIVFKEKYFPNGTIFQANEKSIRIYKDNWLLGEGRGRVFSPPNLLHIDATMSQLNDVDSNWWNTTLIDQVFFFPIEAQKIKTIPICSFPQEDLLFWPSSNGNYSVRSGYPPLCQDSCSTFSLSF